MALRIFIARQSFRFVQTMKNQAIGLVGFMLIATSALAQVRVENPQRTVERNVEWRTNQKIDQGINRGLDKIEEGVGNIFKKKPKKDQSQPTKESGSDTSTPDNTAASDDTAEKKKTGTITNGTADTPKSLKTYSKFDFIPGEKVIAIEDFSQDAVGDFPAKWNTNASGEIVTIDGRPGKWLQFANNGIFFPEFVKQLPENFTLEFDMIVSDNFSEMQSGLKVFFPIITERTLKFDQHFASHPLAAIDIHPTDGNSTTDVWVIDKSNERILENSLALPWQPGLINHISIWKQKTRLRVYVNESKVWDIPKAFLPDLTYSLLFATHIFDGTAYAGNLRVAVGAPDTRSKLITEGKFSTTGILFDVNSDKIKPESYGVLKDISNVLKDNPTVNVKIVGHTDADGDEASNLALSKRRAASVKVALNKEFGIAESRMDTTGKGESEPTSPNTTQEGKANNRRVDFIKF
jgi:outer membrane protein OmpA-like peptidoglycan-associated protein